MTPTIIASIALLFVLLVIGVPVALSFFLSAMVVAIGSGASLSLLMSYSYKNTSSIIHLTIPLIIMAGSIMAYGSSMPRAVSSGALRAASPSSAS